MMAQMWRTALAAHPDVHVVANADDPMVVWAAIAPPHGHLVQRRPALARRLVGLPRVRRRRSSAPTATGGAPAARCAGPAPQWIVEDDGVVDPTGAWHLVKLQLPGTVNLGNAATALAVAAEFGVRPADAVPRLRRGHLGRRPLRPGRARRPADPAAAGQEPGELARGVRHGRGRADPAVDQRPRPRRPRHVVAVRRRLLPAARRPVLITGDRAYDLAVRLRGERACRSSTYGPSTRRSEAVPPGRLEVIANYTAFQDIRAELDRVN